MLDLINRAAGFAKKAHTSQMYGDEDYFYGHLVKVACKYEAIFGRDDVGVCASYLHDIIEDTCETHESVQYVFGDDIADVVNVLTKCKDVSYKEYLKMVSECDIAARIKYCDSIVNLEKCVSTCEWKRAKKYLDNLNFLQEYV